MFSPTNGVNMLMFCPPSPFTRQLQMFFFFFYQFHISSFNLQHSSLFVFSLYSSTEQQDVFYGSLTGAYSAHTLRVSPYWQSRMHAFTFSAVELILYFLFDSYLASGQNDEWTLGAFSRRPALAESLSARSSAVFLRLFLNTDSGNDLK